MSQLDFPGSPFSQAAKQPLMLGVMPSIKGKPSRENSPWDFDYNLRVVQLAEEIGFDVAMSSAQWASLPQQEGGNSLDAFLTPALMAACTKRILLISTLHILYGDWHPLHLAKFAATMDHASKGRWGLNAITGYNLSEFEMFGMGRPEHDSRFDKTAEIMETVMELLAADPGYSRASTTGEWRVKDAWVSPKPLYGRPIMVSAGGSDAAIDYFAKHADAFFTASPSAVHVDANLRALPEYVARIKVKHPKGKVWISPALACRDTMEATLAYIAKETALAPLPPVVRYSVPPKPAMPPQTAVAPPANPSDAQSWLKRGPDSTNYPKPQGIGGSCELFGPPDLVVEQIVKLKETGVDGLMFKFLDYQRDLEYFGERIMPLLVKEGLRLPLTHEDQDA